MKVLHVCRTYLPDSQGGIEEVIRQLCRATDDRVSNTIFSLSPSPKPARILVDQTLVVRERSYWAPASCDLGGLRSLSVFRQLAAQADLIHYYFPWPFADVLHQLARPDTPALMTYVSDVVRQRGLMPIYQPLMNRMLHQMRAIVASSDNYAQSSPVLACPQIRSRLSVIPYGIEDQAQVFGSTKDQPTGGRSPYFLFLGVLRYYKGLEVLLRAAGLTGARVLIAGSGPQQQALQSQAQAMRLANVEWLGFVDDATKHQLIRDAAAVVLPSHLRSEAFGMVLLEAAMHGRPMISCELGTATSFINQDRVTGRVVRPNDPQALTEAMTEMLEFPSLALEYGRAARRRYLAHFTAKRMADDYLGLYERVLSRHQIPVAPVPLDR